MERVARPKARRDFILDSGALSAFADDYRLADAWLQFIHHSYDLPSVLVPTVVLTECFTGEPRDARLHRLLNAVNSGAKPGAFAAYVDFHGAIRAGGLRTRAMHDTPARRAISAVDAQVVAIADKASESTPVTILTTDLDDIQRLVEQTTRRNISIDTPI